MNNIVRPEYVYVASSWRNPRQPAVIEALQAAGIDCYDFRNPPEATGFSWREVKTEGSPPSDVRCERCDHPIAYSMHQLEGWYHVGVSLSEPHRPAPKKGSDWEEVGEYLRMVEHPRAVEGFDSDFGAMQKADTFVLVLPCGKSAHLELGWAVGAGKRTAILLEDPVEPELMYRMVDHLAPSLFSLLGWIAPDAKEGAA